MSEGLITTEIRALPEGRYAVQHHGTTHQILPQTDHRGVGLTCYTCGSERCEGVRVLLALDSRGLL